jgi:co-chaperonin GroES (HSP10)
MSGTPLPSETTSMPQLRGNNDTPVFHPMPGKIVVRPITETQVGNIWLPEDRSRVMGEVLAIGGDEDEGDDFPIAVGDTVLFSRNSGVRIKVDRTEVLVFRTAEILCRITWSEAP